MKIAIDLDQTIFYCDSLAYNIANKFFQLESKKSLKYSNLNTSFEEPNSLLYKIIVSNFNVCNYNKYKEVNGSTRAIRYLLSQGHELYYLSKRPNRKIFTNVVYKWFVEHDIPIENVILNCSNKGGFCKLINVDVLIDDFQKTCDFAVKSGIKVFKFDFKEKDCWDKIIQEIDLLSEKQLQRSGKSLANNESLC